jgi:hypothetical protein
MIALLYLIVAWWSGFTILKRLFPQLFKLAGTESLSDKPAPLANWMVVVPGSFLVGTLFMTWVTYLGAYLCRSAARPLILGNRISFFLFGAVIALGIFTQRDIYRNLIQNLKNSEFSQIKSFFKNNRLELIFIFIFLVMVSFLMFHVFHIQDNTIQIGLSVFSDFGPHLAVIRSFSLGSNFPTEYPHFADGHARYHFLFQFLVGNLEFLGLRLDWAFNLPSILSLVAFLMLLYSLAVLLMGAKWVGVLTGILFFFRSSWAFVTYLASIPPSQWLPSIFANDGFIGKTLHEDWGLWTQNVYINQRHLAFSLGILLLILILLYPLYRKMTAAFKALKKEETATSEVTENIGPLPEPEPETTIVPPGRFRKWPYPRTAEFLTKKDAWLPENWLRAIAIGILLGATSFWNGAVLIAAVFILIFTAVFSKHRLEYVVIAIPTLILTLLQAQFFIGSGGEAVKPQFVYGFLANSPDLKVIAGYYLELLGILPWIVFAGLFLAPKGSRWLVIPFVIPLIFATTVQLTPDLAVNHKYVMISVILLNIIAAGIIYRLFKTQFIFTKIIAILLVFALTFTGFIDFFTVVNRNRAERTIRIRADDPVLTWVAQNTDPHALFLTGRYCIHPILLAGRKIFYGWPYFPWSAGYDTNGREPIVRQIYSCQDETTLRELVRGNRINYVVIDDDNRRAEDYRLNEILINKTFRLVYENIGSNISIYTTN